jgi:hypothetical protein
LYDLVGRYFPARPDDLGREQPSAGTVIVAGPSPVVIVRSRGLCW